MSPGVEGRRTQDARAQEGHATSRARNAVRGPESGVPSAFHDASKRLRNRRGGNPDPRTRQVKKILRFFA